MPLKAGADFNANLASVLLTTVLFKVETKMATLLTFEDSSEKGGEVVKATKYIV